jgi:hypothetical protein
MFANQKLRRTFRHSRGAVAGAIALAAAAFALMPALAGGAAKPTTVTVGATGTTTYVPGGTSAPVIPTTTTPSAAPGSRLPTLGLGNGSAFGRRLARPRRHAAKHGISGWESALIAGAAVLVLVLAGWAAVRRRAHDPHWWLALRHSFAEAGFRASETWAEFTDWARLGH